MATTTDNEKHLRLILMLVKGGTRITRALFEKCYKAMTPKDHDPFPWTIDEFLQENKKKILSHHTGKTKERIFYPVASGTEIEHWDLYMLCYVLVDVCRVTPAIRMDVDQLKKMRNKLCHLSKPSVETTMYERYVYKIKVNFDRLLVQIDDELLTAETHKMLQAAKEGPLSLQDTHNYMHMFYSTLECEIQGFLSRLSEDVNEVKETTRNLERNLIHNKTEAATVTGSQNSDLSTISDLLLEETFSTTTEDEKRVHPALSLTIKADQVGRGKLKESVKNGSFRSSINRLRETIVSEYDLNIASIEAHIIDDKSPSVTGADQDQDVGAVSQELDFKYEDIAKNVNRTVSRDSNIAKHAITFKVGKAMATMTNNEKYYRLVLMLMKGGTKVTRALFEKCYKAMTPKDHDPFPWTIDEFLQANKKTILSHHTGKAKERIFYPAASGTEIVHWDLFVLCYVLVDVCRVTQAICMDLDKLKKMRNKLCHLREPSVDTYMYERYVKELEIIFDRLLMEIDDQLMTEELTNELQAAMKEPLSPQDTLHEMQNFYSIEGEIRELLSQQSKDIKEIMEDLRQTERKQDQFLKNQMRNETEAVQVPEINIEQLVQNCVSDKEEFISKRVLDMYREGTGISMAAQSKEEYVQMMEVVMDVVAVNADTEIDA